VPRVDVNGIELSFRDSGGEGTPVVLIHGFPFEAALWDPQFEALGRRFRLIAPDLRGYGRSSQPADGLFTMTAFADDVAGLLEYLEVEQAVIGGLSMGGYTTFEFLRRHPERVRALILADTRPDDDPVEVRERRQTQIRQIREGGASGLVDGMVAAVLADASRTPDRRVEAKLRSVMDQDDRSWIGGLEAMLGRSDSRAALGDISVPALILVGEHDGITPPELAREMHERIPNSKLIVIEGAGHIANLENPAAFNAALETFLEEL
jgi:3-oxoadipate enol-lactonase